MSEHDHQDDSELEWGKSKSQLKREMQELQELGKKMLELSTEQLKTLPITDTLQRAISESHRIRQHEARRRHLQYIGKVIRQEEDIDTIRRAIEAFHAGSEEHTRRLHLAERWRDRLINEGDSALGEFIEYCPVADVQHLRNLARNARRDVQKEKNTGQSKKLFRYLRECIDEGEQAGSTD
ncbi:ribosome biogenesis factor YjgA [Marinobacter mobilis]|uniref:Dual-action ribosomal maturation protein DarP n=1 Tax=Marinobacter mobilis TaxID=488533 RepID=A0A1H2TEC4_9GAMM|nr:ribosome biogenesis factor YjgA [Marinobacter mobilis]SDW42222.1 ribosome-associated protein [Marinobacter mobilis]